MKTRLMFPMVALFLLAAPLDVRCDEPLDTETLLSEMIDLQGLCFFPKPYFSCRQFSSFDRGSVSPDQGWFANRDCGNFLRTEENQGRTEYVMMDARGPGAVVRIWSANPGGTMRVYIDGSPRPALEAAMTDLLSGKTDGFPHPICHTSSKGWNSYYPFPYSRSCKITSDAGNFYYQINYRTYESGTPVVSFDSETAARMKTEAERVAGVLATSCDSLRVAGKCVERPFELNWEEGSTGTITMARITGEQAVRSLSIEVKAADPDAALRGLVLRGTFDGIETIVTPLGDFFGTAPGRDAYQSLPLGITEDGVLQSRWMMPFRRKAEFRVENRLGIAAAVKGVILSSPEAWTDRSMYFHARWRIDKQIATRPMQDWNYLHAGGRGVYVGDALYIANPVKGWWGEGDEKIYVDNETFPSHFGTGTEDYYGYAWCSPDLFHHAFHNQPRCDGPGNYGHTSINRWHIIDCIPFKEAFRMDMEVWHWTDTKIDYAVTAYWYALPGGRDNFESPSLDDLELSKIPEYVVRRVEGAIEAEEMTVLSKVGTAQRQDASNAYSGEAQLWWQGASKGDELFLAFESSEKGRRRVIAVFTKAPDYGIHQITVNGQKAGHPIDLYKSGPWGPTEEIELGIFPISKGRNLITVSVVGTNEKAVKKHMFGMDYIRIVK